MRASDMTTGICVIRDWMECRLAPLQFLHQVAIGVRIAHRHIECAQVDTGRIVGQQTAIAATGSRLHIQYLHIVVLLLLL